MGGTNTFDSSVCLCACMRVCASVMLTVPGCSRSLSVGADMLSESLMAAMLEGVDLCV